MTLNLLKHQFDMINDTQHKIIALVAGYGSGKSYIMARKAIMLMLANPGFDGAMTEPTFSLITEILLPEMHKALKEFNISYIYKAGENIFYCQVLDPCTKTFKETRIICKSMENYERLIGLNLAWVCADEIDTSRASLGYAAYIKLLGRIRVGNIRQFCMFSTPEGFKTLYRIFVEEADDTKRLIRAKSSDNIHLPMDFLDTMRDQYPAELVEAYINGEFVNMAQGAVYPHYDRSKNDTSMTDDGRSVLHIGVDFNVNKMAAVVSLFKDQKIYIIDEFFEYADTEALAQAIVEKYPDRDIIAYPDASGKNTAAQSGDWTSHKILQSYKMRLRVNPRNPGVQDRVNTVNARFSNSTNKVHLMISSTCTNLMKCVEQQAYDKNGKPEKNRDTDHMNDALGYLVSFLLPITVQRKIPKKGRNYYEPHANV